MSLSVLLAVAFVGAALYYVCPLRFRWVLMLLLSYGFYLTCGVSALPFILITTLTTWAGALKIGRIGESGKAYLHEHKAELTAEEKKARKAKTRSAQRIWFFAVLLLNFGVLAVLKYLNPVMAWGASLTGKNAPALGLGLPLETISWGSMLSLAEKALLTGSWWIILIPGAFLALTLLSITDLAHNFQTASARGQRNL